MEQLALLVGERVENDLPFGSTQELQSLLVTNKNVINKSLGYLNLQRTFNCTVTRVRRSGIDLSPEPELMLKFGDKLPIIWSMSGSANQLLRQIGLLLFLAEVGTSAGVNLVSTFQESGWTLFGIGMAITIVPMIVAVLFGYFVFKIHILDLIGTIAGGMTSTPGLAAADSMSDSSVPSIAYATVYPIAMVFLILFIQFIAALIV